MIATIFCTRYSWYLGMCKKRWWYICHELICSEIRCSSNFNCDRKVNDMGPSLRDYDNYRVTIYIRLQMTTNPHGRPFYFAGLVYWESGDFTWYKNYEALPMCFYTLINSLWPSNATWRDIHLSTLALVKACCLTKQSHYLNKCWLNHQLGYVAFTWRYLHRKSSIYLCYIRALHLLI